MFSSGEEAALLEHGSIRIPNQHPAVVSKWPGYDTGDWWVQDPSASLPAIALERLLSRDNPTTLEHLHVVDLCSAPGGKTAQLCSFGFGKVTAVELSSQRTKSLSENLDRLGMNKRCEIVVADGREWRPQNDERVDAILLDAPCSATGVCRRRPDVLRKSPDLQEITTLQRELAIHAIDNLLKDGGVLIYATCSLLHSESEDQVQWLLSREDGPDIENVPFEVGEIPGFDSAINENGWLRVIPGQLTGPQIDSDGFFVARLRRKHIDL
jgi:16S rRNA (cytosine967-C5)-methyltransferase